MDKILDPFRHVGRAIREGKYASYTRKACFVTGNTQGTLRKFDHPVEAYVSEKALHDNRSSIVKVQVQSEKSGKIKTVRAIVGPLRARLDQLEAVNEG